MTGLQEENKSRKKPLKKYLGEAANGKFAVRVLYPLILLLYPLRHIRVGVEWWDTGYNYGNFVFMDQMDPMWVFSTYLGNALGNLFTKLPGGDRMLGLNFYTGLMVSLLALMGYFFFLRLKKMPAWVIFLGEFLAVNLCWCPTALLYNYLTYVLMAACWIALYYGVMQEKRRLLVLAGIFLGCNVFVRFPNLAEMGFIVGVWAMGIIRKKKLRQIAAQTGWCVLGYGLGAGGCLAYLSLRYGLKEYVAGITRLLSMPSEASDYSLYSMIYGQISNYIENLKWFGVLVLAMLCGILIFQILPERLVWGKRIVSIVLILGGFAYLAARKIYLFDYTSTRSVFHWAVFFLVAALVIGVLTVFHKNAETGERMLAGMGVLIILITPLGSNNHLYSAFNNLFLIAPFVLWMLGRFLGQLPQKAALLRGKLHFFTFPVKALCVLMLLMLGIQSLLFGWTYVFMESKGGQNLHTKIENNDILKGMYADPEHAQELESISAYANERGLAGREVILYGYIPSMSYYLQMPFALTPWPDLASYHYSVMEEALEQMADGIESGERELPVLLLEVQYGTWIQGGEEAAAALGTAPEKLTAIREDKKFGLLCGWAEKYDYQVTFQNEKFVILEAMQ